MKAIGLRREPHPPNPIVIPDSNEATASAADICLSDMRSPSEGGRLAGGVSIVVAPVAGSRWRSPHVRCSILTLRQILARLPGGT